MKRRSFLSLVAGLALSPTAALTPKPEPLKTGFWSDEKSSMDFRMSKEHLYAENGDHIAERIIISITGPLDSPWKGLPVSRKGYYIEKLDLTMVEPGILQYVQTLRTVPW